MIQYSDELSFNYLIFFVNISITSLVFFYKYNKCNGLEKIFLTVFSLLYYFYSGFGASYSIVPIYYSLMYNVYYITFLYVFFFIVNNKNIFISEYKLNLIKRFSNIIIFSYLFFTFLAAGYPSYDLSKLFVIKPPSLEFELSDSIAFQQSPLIKIFTYFLLIIQPFYLVSLIKYKNKPLKLFIFLFLPLYFYYTLGGYIARSYLLPYIAIYLFIIYNYNVKLRNYIKYGTLTTIPLFIILSYRFSEVRIGHDIDISLSFIDIFKIIFFQETTYPILFTNIYVMNLENKIIDFFLWLTTLPIPSFLKGSQFSLEINYYFTELLTGKNKFSEGLSVFLPGNVTESYLVFGKYLFFMMPMIGGVIFGLLYRLISSSSYFTVLKIYFIFMLLPLITRAGLNSATPVAINGFLVFFLYFKLKK